MSNLFEVLCGTVAGAIKVYGIPLLGFTSVAIGYRYIDARTKGSQKVILTYLLCILAATAAVMGRNDGVVRLRWLLSAIPGLLILNQGLVLYHLRRDVGASELDKKEWEPKEAPGIAKGAKDTISRYFSLEALLVRYGLPGVLVTSSCLTLSAFLIPTGSTLAGLSPEIVTGARLGLVGAYVYVVLQLGIRSFRQDITVGAASWSLVTLAVGPVLAGTLGVTVTSPPASEASTDAVLPVSTQAFMFVAGFSPRPIATFIVNMVQKTYLGSSSAPPTVNVIPLSRVRGIGLRTEERLNEEDIEDAHALATADPLRLMRNTAYDKRQILAWMDHAILLTTLPTIASKLEELGITGAIDFAASDDNTIESVKGKLQGEWDKNILISVRDRLRQDRQLALVWLLYQTDGEEISTG